MFDHIGLRVKDIHASTRFYAAALHPLGFVRDGSGFGPEGAPALWLYEGDGKNRGTHVALKARSRAAVDAFHEAGIKAGGKDNGAPGLRKDYSPSYYAAFLVDPDGNDLRKAPLKDRRATLEASFERMGKQKFLQLSPATRSVKTAQNWLKKIGHGLDGIEGEHTAEH